MSNFDEVLNNCKTQIEKCDGGYDESLLTSITKSLGPSIYNNDALLVAAADKTEANTVMTNFISKKLGVEGADAESAFNYAVEKLGSSNPKKLRPVFYYFIVEKLKKESVFK